MNIKPMFLSDEHTRSFGGKISDFDSKEERKFEGKHLKAYLKGKKSFNYGYETVKMNPLTGMKVDEGENGGIEVHQPIKHEVKEVWTPKNNK